VTAVVVADAGPLIGLARIDRLSVLASLYGSVLVPELVLAELHVDSDRPGARALFAAVAQGRLYPTRIGATPCQHWARRQFRISRGWLQGDLQQAQYLFLLRGRDAVLVELRTVDGDSVTGDLSQAIDHAPKCPAPLLSLSIMGKQGR